MSKALKSNELLKYLNKRALLPYELQHYIWQHEKCELNKKSLKEREAKCRSLFASTRSQMDLYSVEERRMNERWTADETTNHTRKQSEWRQIFLFCINFRSNGNYITGRIFIEARASAKDFRGVKWKLCGGILWKSLICVPCKF